MFYNQTINEIIEKDTTLSRLEYYVLHTLGRFFGQKNRCWPSQKKLAEAAKLSLSSIKRALSMLKKRGYIMVKKVRFLNNYYLNLDFIKNLFGAVKEVHFEPSRVHPEPLEGKQRNKLKDNTYNVSDNERRFEEKKPMNHTEILDNFEPTSEHQTLANKKSVDIDQQLTLFKNYYKAKGKAFMMYGPLFTNWLTICNPNKNTGAKNGRKESGGDIIWRRYREAFGLDTRKVDESPIYEA
jgi:Helix-turn-helix domain